MPTPEQPKKTPCQKIVRDIMMWTNILIALTVIGYGIYVYCTFGNYTISVSFVFLPFYLILFGWLLICAECEWLWMIKYFKFADNLFGRSIYNFFLATLVLSATTSSDNSNNLKIVRITLASLLAGVGTLQIIFYFLDCCGKSEKYEKYDQQLKQEMLVQQKMSEMQQQQQVQQQQSSQQAIQMQNDPKAYIVWLQDQVAITQAKLQQQGQQQQ